MPLHPVPPGLLLPAVPPAVYATRQEVHCQYFEVESLDWRRHLVREEATGKQYEVDAETQLITRKGKPVPNRELNVWCSAYTRYYLLGWAVSQHVWQRLAHHYATSLPAPPLGPLPSPTRKKVATLAKQPIPTPLFPNL